MKLHYHRGKLLMLGLAIIALGLTVALFAFGDMERRAGLVGVAVMLLGPNGAKIFLLVIGTLCTIGGVRLLWLMGEGGMAAAIAPDGIRIRSTLSGGHFRWSEITKVSMTFAEHWGNDGVIVFERARKAGGLQWLLGAGSRIVVQPKLLRTDTAHIAQFIVATRDRDARRPQTAVEPTPPPRHTGFGRRV